MSYLADTQIKPPKKPPDLRDLEIGDLPINRSRHLIHRPILRSGNSDLGDLEATKQANLEKSPFPAPNRTHRPGRPGLLSNIDSDIDMDHEPISAIADFGSARSQDLRFRIAARSCDLGFDIRFDTKPGFEIGGSILRSRKSGESAQ